MKSPKTNSTRKWTKSTILQNIIFKKIPKIPFQWVFRLRVSTRHEAAWLECHTQRHFETIGKRFSTACKTILLTTRGFFIYDFDLFQIEKHLDKKAAVPTWAYSEFLDCSAICRENVCAYLKKSREHQNFKVLVVEARFFLFFSAQSDIGVRLWNDRWFTNNYEIEPKKLNVRLKSGSSEPSIAAKSF